MEGLCRDIEGVDTDIIALVLLSHIREIKGNHLDDGVAYRCLRLCGGGVGLAQEEGASLVSGENGARDGEAAASLDLYFVSGEEHQGAH